MNLKTNSIVFIVLFISFFVQLFFVEYYWNDKTTTSSRIISNMQNNNGLVAHDFACYEPDRKTSQYKTWGEEPPLFHYVAMSFKFILGDWSLKLVPLLCFVFSIWGLYLIIGTLTQTSFEEKYWILIPLTFTPSFYIHTIRFLPDNLALTFLVFGLYYFIKNQWKLAWILFLFSTTTKALAIVPVAFLCLFYLIEYRLSWKKNLPKLLGFSLCLIPTFMWFYYLHKNNISNPFFETGNMIPQHAGGSDFSILQTRKYWSKIFQWYFYRGIGILWLILFMVSFFKKIELRSMTKILAQTALSFIANVILLRGPQITAPWYSFYYQIFFIIVAGTVFIKLSNKWKIIISILSVLQSIFFLHYGVFPPPKYSDADIELPCNFHQFIHALKKEKI